MKKTTSRPETTITEQPQTQHSDSSRSPDTGLTAEIESVPPCALPVVADLSRPTPVLPDNPEHVVHNGESSIEHYVHPSLFRISRSIDEGDFYPDWRLQQVEAYLAALAGPCRHRAMHLEDLEIEQDVLILNLLSLRLGRSAPPAFSWAWDIHRGNGHSGLASIMKALALAGCSSDQIAGWLNFGIDKVDLYLKLFWDVEEARQFKGFLADTLFQSGKASPEDRAAQREHLLLTAAVCEGLLGVMLVLTQNLGLAPSESDRVLHRIKASSTMDALRAAYGLNRGVANQSSPTDLYMAILKEMAALPRTIEADRNRLFEDKLAALGKGLQLSQII